MAPLQGTPRVGGWTVSLRTFVTVVMLVALLPLLAHAVFGTWYTYKSTRGWAERDLMDDAEHMARHIDTHLDVARSVMTFAAASPAATRGDRASLRQHLELARTHGVIAAAVVRDTEGRAIMAVGVPADELATLAPATSDQFTAARLAGRPALVASWPIRSQDTSLARLDFLVPADLPPVTGPEAHPEPWHVAAIADSAGRIAWSAPQAPELRLPPVIGDPAALSGVLRDGGTNLGAGEATAFARAPRSGLTVVIAQPMPSLYDRMPLGPMGALASLVAVSLASLAIARFGAQKIQAEYHGATHGPRAARLRIDDAVHLADALRRSRDRLFHAAGGIAVLELSRPPGSPWRDSRILASPNIHAMLDTDGEAVSAETLLRHMAAPDRAAFAAMLDSSDADATAFTRSLRFQRPGFPARHVNLVGILRDPVAGQDDELVLMLQDITAQKSTQEELDAQASRLRLATEIAQLGVWERDAVRNIGHGSPRFWHIVGRDPTPSLTVQDFFAMVHPDDRAHVAESLAKVLPEEDPTTARDAAPPPQISYRVLRPDGTVRHIRASRVTVGDGTGGISRFVGVIQDETEAVLAQRALAASEARFRLAVEVAELGVFERTVGPTGNIGVWNERMWRIRGLDPRPEPMPYDELVAMVHPEDRARIETTMRERRLKGDGVTNYDFRLLRADGEERIVHSRSARAYNPEDNTLSIIAINQDITDRRRAERALAESEARFRLAVDTAGLGIAELNLETGGGLWNSQLYRICGIGPAEGRPSLDTIKAMLHPDDLEAFTTTLAAQRIAPDGAITEFDARLRRPDGEERMLHVRSATLLPPGGERTLLTVMLDVTDRRRAEQALADSEQRLRLATEGTGVGIWDFDPTTGRVVWSDRMWRLRGALPQAVPLDMESQLVNIVPEDRPVMRRVWTWIQAGYAQFNYDYRVVLPNGSVRHLHGEGRTLRDATGRILRCVGMVMDVTAQRLAALALQDKTTTLELVLEAADLGVWVRDPDREAREASPRVWAMLGHPHRSGTMTTEDLFGSLHPDDRDAMRRDWITAAGDPTPRRRNFRTVWPDGTVHHILAHRAVLRDDTGRVVRIIGVIADVTEAREATERLEASETRLRLAVDAAELGVFDYDPLTREGSWSDRTWQLRGLAPRPGIPSPEEVLATVHPDDRAVALARSAAQHDAADGTRIDNEFRVVWPDGTIRHLQLRALVRHTPEGRARVFGVNLDVTERRNAALALAASEARLRLASEIADLGIFQMSMPAGTGLWSDRMWSIRGWAPRPGVPDIAEVLAIIHPDDREKVGAFWRPAGSGAHGDVSRIQYRLTHTDGTLRHIAAAGIVLRSEGENSWTYTGINVDNTEQVEREQALRETAARYELALDAAGFGVFEFDPEKRTGFWSDRIWQMRGLTPRPGFLAFDEIVALVHPDERETMAGRMREQFAQPDGTRRDYEFRVVRPDGSVRHIQSHAIAQRRTDGRLSRIFGINLDITERRLAARALEESEVRLRLAAEVSQLGVFQFSMPGATGYWSERMWRMRGWEPGSGIPDSAQVATSIHPEDRERIEGTRLRAATRPHGDVHTSQYRIVLPQGAIRHIVAHSIVLHGPGPADWTLIGVNADITEQVEREQVLSDNAARYQLAIDAAGLAVWEWDIAAEAMTWSPRIWEIIDLAPNNALPTLPDRMLLVHPEDRAHVPSVWIRRAGVAGEERGEGDFRIARTDGTTRYLHWKGIPLRDPRGRAVRFAGIVADITEARLAEMKLRANEEIFRMAAEAAEQGVWDHDLATGAITWTARLWRIHGLPPAEGAPAREERVALIHPEDRADVLALSDELSANPREIARRSYRITRPDGAVRSLERQAMLIPGPDGQLGRIVGVVRDVTEAQELSAQAMVADKLATLGEMAGAIAHELAQPLQTVMASAATARVRLSDDADAETIQGVRDRLAWIEHQTARAGRTIQHLLAFSRGESSSGICRLAEAVQGAMELVGHGLRRTGIGISIDVPDTLPMIAGGLVEVEQVLVNLLTNARDAIGDRPQRQIAIAARITEKSILLDVDDSGGGVPEDKFARIFEPFFTTKPVGKGTGIGLCVARRTMDALGGAIAVSNHGPGARFTLAFPYFPADI